MLKLSSIFFIFLNLKAIFEDTFAGRYKLMKAIISLILTLASIATGLWLHKGGRPLNQIIFTIHKILVIGLTVLTIINFNQLLKSAKINPLTKNVIALTSIVFLIVFVTGALLSFDKLLNPYTTMIHKISPYLLLIALIGLYYFN